jgi:hypothetical protein
LNSSVFALLAFAFWQKPLIGHRENRRNLYTNGSALPHVRLLILAFHPNWPIQHDISNHPETS